MDDLFEQLAELTKPTDHATRVVDMATEHGEKMYEMGKLSGRSEAIATVINLLKENPNIDGLEILKKL